MATKSIWTPATSDRRGRTLASHFYENCCLRQGGQPCEYPHELTDVGKPGRTGADPRRTGGGGWVRFNVGREITRIYTHAGRGEGSSSRFGLWSISTNAVFFLSTYVRKKRTAEFTVLLRAPYRCLDGPLCRQGNMYRCTNMATLADIKLTRGTDPLWYIIIERGDLFISWSSRKSYQPHQIVSS